MRKAILVAVICFSAASLALAAGAEAAIQKPTNIPPQGLRAALQELSREREFQVVFRTDVVGDLKTYGARGDLTRDEALAQLLSGTGLAYRSVDEETVTIISAGGSQAAPDAMVPQDDANAQGDQKLPFWDRFRLAQVDQGASASASSVKLASRPDSDQSSLNLEEVVVTATKRSERLIDVPTSIVAVGADELQQRQITSLEDLPSAVPGFSYLRTGSNVYYEVRGISNALGTGSLVGLYIDEADLTLGGSGGVQANPATYDLERVEVLRGPQGTLYGEGSAGGTIRFITRNPNLSRVVFDSQVTALFTEGGDPSQRINAMVNVPLIENQLGLRMATTFEHDGGWIDLAGTDQGHINVQNLTNVRLKGLWQPNAQLTASAMAILNRNDRSMDYTDSQTPTEWTQSFNLAAKPSVRNDYDLYNLTLSYDVSSSMRILNTTTYIRSSDQVLNTGGEFPVLGPPGPGGPPPLELYDPYSKFSDHLWTDELRLASTGSGRWQWTVGGFYRHYRDGNLGDPGYIGPPIPAGASLPDPGPSTLLDILYKSWSAFGDTSYRLSDRFTLGVGTRYFREDQDYRQRLGVTATRQTAQFHSLDPRAYAQFKLAPDVNIYASAAKGFRSGGFNVDPSQPAYGPESVWTYELGTKMAVMEGRIGFDAAAFWSNYTGYQTTGLTSAEGLIPAYSNAGNARIKGIESSLTWRPLDHWRVDLRGDYLDTRFLEVNTFPNPSTGQPSSGFVVGDTLNYVPRYQFTTSGQRDFLLLGRQGFIRLDYSQQGPEIFRLRNFGSWYHGQSDVIHLLSLRVGLQLNDNMSVGFSAQNLLNDQGFVNPLSFERSGVRSRPRTFGVDFSAALN